ncbi:MAG TPA: glycosyltransferase family 39 protein [Acidimicrobiales bacterium]
MQIVDVEAPRHQTSRWVSGWRLALVFTLLAVATHLPSLVRTEALNPDEAFLATQAQVLNDGGRLYQDVVDRKPPIVPYLYAAASRLTGSDALLSVRLLAIGAYVVSALLVAAIARRRWGDHAAVAAGVLYLVATGGLVLEDSQPANFEVFMMPLMCAAMYFGDRERTSASGVLAALATLAKQTAAATLLPLAWRSWQRERLSGLIRLGVAFVVPIAIAAVAFGWHDFMFWVFTGNGGYLDANGSWGVAANRGLASTGIFLGANVAAFLLVIAAARRWREDIDLWLWLISAFVAVAAGFRFFGHYYLQLGPPFALLAAGSLVRATRAVWVRTAALAGASVVVFVTLGLTAHPILLHRYDHIADAIDARTKPTDKIFVWGQFPQAYWASDRRPATRFLTAGFLTGLTGGRSGDRVGVQYAVPGAWDEFRSDLAAHPPVLIVDTSLGSPASIAHFPEFDSYVRDNYTPVEIVDGAVLYARRDAHP